MRTSCSDVSSLRSIARCTSAIVASTTSNAGSAARASCAAQTPSTSNPPSASARNTRSAARVWRFWCLTPLVPDSDCGSRMLDRRLLPAAGLGLEIRGEREADVLAPRLRDHLQTDRQLAVGGAAAAHDDARPAGRVEHARVRPTVAGAATAAAVTAADLIDRLRGPPRDRADERVVLLHPSEHLRLREVLVLPRLHHLGRREWRVGLVLRSEERRVGKE